VVLAKLPDRFMLVLAFGGGAICAWGLGIDFGGARWGPHAESHVGARAMVLPSSSAWRARKNLPAVSHLPDLTGNGKIPKTAGLPDLPVGKPIQI